MQKSQIQLYPIYFNTRVSRAEGRRVVHVDNGIIPTLQQICKALTALGIEHKTERNSHPNQTYEVSAKFLSESAKPEEIERHQAAHTGRIIIENLPHEETKKRIIRKVYLELSK
ncbi:hypothetical protein NEFER03_0941 [Nematocida sp. LUAm3]|nr:hypothetical protein NEFER03_0941 [Nematocida sp. LUAm3]KAI5174959.1 hypothetical protein NEFER02_1059 [Nematocida sp. LUAm2]KAI5177442.1 hypothetical protein NEFER01_0692 [Nematocida sp. LUAm1]